MQTAIYCDTFGLQSFGARNSSLCDSVQFLLCFILNLRAISNFNGEFFALRVGGGGGLIFGGAYYTWRGLFLEFYGNLCTMFQSVCCLFHAKSTFIGPLKTVVFF